MDLGAYVQIKDLDAVEDSFDSVYCDIYAKIKPVELHQTL